MKTCSKCGVEKPLEEFTKSTQNKSGYHAHCKSCDNKRKRESEARIREADPIAWRDRQKTYVKTYKERHPDRAQAYEHKRNLRRKFGITPEQYEEMGKAQNWTCLCGVQPTNKRFAVDHDHNCCPGQTSCGKCLRGLLCGNCNTALGLLKENVETMLNLIKYVEKYR